MAITRPATKTVISTTAFGIPVADQLNAAPRGLVARISSTAVYNNLGPVYIDFYTVSFIAETNHWYQATAGITTLSNAGGATLIIARITDGAYNSLYGWQNGIWAGGQIGLSIASPPFKLTAGAQSIRLRLYSSGAGTTVVNASDQPGYLAVADLGMNLP